MGDVIDMEEARRRRDELRELEAERKAAELRYLIEMQAKLLEMAEELKRDQQETDDESDPT
jgi:hypothetical protein